MALPLNAAQAFTALAGRSANVKAGALLNGAKEGATELNGTCKITPVKGRRKAGDRDSCTMDLPGTATWNAEVIRP